MEERREQSVTQQKVVLGGGGRGSRPRKRDAAPLPHECLPGHRAALRRWLLLAPTRLPLPIAPSRSVLAHSTAVAAGQHPSPGYCIRTRHRQSSDIRLCGGRSRLRMATSTTCSGPCASAAAPSVPTTAAPTWLYDACTTAPLLVGASCAPPLTSQHRAVLPLQRRPRLRRPHRPAADSLTPPVRTHRKSQPWSPGPI
jgi:hypothetical protein